MKPIDRLSLGRYLGSISYPDGCQLEELDVLVDTEGNLEVRWLELPGKPSCIGSQADSYTVAFADGTTMCLRGADA